MDAHLFRLNQQQIHQSHTTGASRAQVHPRAHYTSRQQPGAAHASASDPEERQPSSLNSASSATDKTTSSSQAAMLARHQNAHLQQHQQQQLLQMQARQRRQQQQQQHLAAAARHQQQQQQAGGPGPARRAAAHASAANSASTASSGSVDSADQLQRLDEAGPGQRLAAGHSSGSSASLGQGAAGARRHFGAANLLQSQHHQPLLDSLASSSTAGPGLARHSAGAGAAAGAGPGGRFLLGVLFTLAELLLVAELLLWLYWAFQHDDGLAWQGERKQQFNAHASLMLLGLVFLSGQALLVHRAFQCCSRIYTKILHTILFVLATSAIGLGLIVAYAAQENVGPAAKPIMHFYSLHAWCGLATVGLFGLQFVLGFVSFLILLCCDQATAGFRAALLPIHRTFGLIIFSLAVATSLMGLLQTARSRLSSKLNKIDYHELAEPGIVINLIGVCLVCLAILMPYIIRNLDIRRPFRSELDRQLSKLSQFDLRI